jgi:hypothetical protein
MQLNFITSDLRSLGWDLSIINQILPNSWLSSPEISALSGKRKKKKKKKKNLREIAF